MMNDTEKWVRKLYKLGFTPIPIKKQNKEPNGFEYEELNFYHYHRPEKEIIDIWLKEGLYENIGLLLGDEHGKLVCFDFDKPKSFNDLKLNQEILLKEGYWVVKTPKQVGRYHIYAVSDKPLDYTRQTKCSVELRYNKHYVLFYPSIHPNGKQYDLLNTHNPDELTIPKSADIESIWEHWKIELEKVNGEKERFQDNLKEKKEYDRGPDCVRNAIEMGAKKGQRQMTILGLASWMKQKKIPMNMATNVILEWFRSKCEHGDKPESQVIGAVESGYKGKSTGCGWWRDNTDFCPYLEKTDCPFYKPDIKTNQQLLIEYGVIEEGDSVHVNCPQLAELLMKEHDYHFVSIYDDTVNKREIFYYGDGYYHTNGEMKIRHLVNYYLENMTSEHRKSEVIGYIKDQRMLHRRKIEAPVNLINLKNGIFDINTDELKPHSPDYYFLSQLPIEYKANADCPKIKRFFSQIFPGKFAEYIPVIQEMFGFCLYREYFLHVAFMLYGKGRNGKGVTINLLRLLLGEHNYSTRGLHELAEDTFAKADLYGKLANIGAEISDRALSETRTFKNLTGGEPIGGRKMYLGQFNFMNHAKLIFSVNKIPWSKDKTYAFFERWIIPVFSQTYQRGDPKTIPRIIDALATDEEMSGLFNWAIEGLKRLLKNNNFSYHEDPDELGNRYEILARPEKGFIIENYEYIEGGKLPKDEVYDKYRAWADDNKYAILTKGSFTRQLLYYLKGCKAGAMSKNGARIKAYLNIRYTDGNGENSSLPDSNNGTLKSGLYINGEYQDQKTLEPKFRSKEEKELYLRRNY